ncbi:MAG: anaerobic carbon-monoxide dehydrogenase catalytic subunit, partial [Planctomycetota bacterium]|nr:anaerobic carbon-monoxide dehydrogenase catalytic subunit [Planctomycetota bacterium]
SICKATCEMLEVAEKENVPTVFQRAATLKPCPIGSAGTCCKVCMMGPCRINPKKPEEGRGVCGADAGIIAARNFCRMIAAGTSAHSDHGRAVVQTFIGAARREVQGYDIKDEVKLHKLAGMWNVATEGKTKYQIAEEIGNIAVQDYTRQDGELNFIKRAPKPRQEIWKKLGMVPRAVDREVVEMMHRTSTGVDLDVKNLLIQGSRCALADGWGGSMLATELQDIMFGTPFPLRGKVNLGVLKEDEVNIVVHGHEPLLSEMIVTVAREKEMIEYAKQHGAKGINLSGICCTANEMLTRHGVPLAGNMVQQELAILTGAVEAMVVDVQCIMPSLVEVASRRHTKIITTSSKAKLAGAQHIQFDEHHALDSARQIVKTAIENYKKRGKTCIPKDSSDLIAGFSHETINYMLGGTYRQSYRPLNDNIMNGKIRGIVGVVGCNNPRVTHDSVHVNLVKELIANDILVVQTGCSAMACAKANLLTPEAVKFAGKGLAEVCETVGIPPVLHSGSCVDNSRILVACTEMVLEGGLGNDISDLPVAGCAPEWMSEKAIAIGQYFVASGALVAFGVSFPVLGSEVLTNLLFKEFETMTGGRWAFEPDPSKLAALFIDHINKKRAGLGIDKAKERVLFDMDMRQKIEF